MREQWLAVPDYEGLYEASNLGKVRSLDIAITRVNGQPWSRKGRILKQYYSKKNYLIVNLSKENKQRSTPVHRIVCRAFHGEPSPGQEVRHLNGKDTDNRSINLCWGTRAENAQDTLKHGRHYLASATHCKHGHPFDEENTYRRKAGDRIHRQCRACKRTGNPLPSNNTSGYRGVSLYRRTGKWRACVKQHGKAMHLGFFDTAKEAALIASAARERLGIK